MAALPRSYVVPMYKIRPSRRAAGGPYRKYIYRSFFRRAPKVESAGGSCNHLQRKRGMFEEAKKGYEMTSLNVIGAARTMGERKMSSLVGLWGRNRSLVL